MKKGFALWIKTTDAFHRTVPLLLAGAVLLSVFLWIRPSYIQRINGLELSNKQGAYFFIMAAVLLTMCITLFQIWGEALRSHFQMAYWLVLTEREFYVYLLLKKHCWYYAFGIVIFLAGGELWNNSVFVFCFLSILYLILTVLIYFCHMFMTHRGGRYHSGKVRGAVIKNGRGGVGPRFPNLELIFISWRYRYLSWERMICKAAVLGMGIFLLGRNLSDPYCTIVYFGLYFILSCVDDNYWKRESVNAALLRNMGVSFGRYFLIHTVSGSLYYSVLLSLFYGLACGSVLKGATFLFGTVCLVCYWNVAYLYLYLSGGERMDMLKLLYLFAVVTAMFVPVVNLAVGLFLWRKVRRFWRSAVC